MKFAPLSLRFIATSLDLIICASLILLVSIIFPNLANGTCFYITFAAYWVIMVACFQSTLGGMVLSIAITTEKEEPLSVMRIILRILPELAVLIGFQMILPHNGHHGENNLFHPLLLECLPWITYIICVSSAFFTKEKATLFDKLCNTRYIITSSATLFFTPAPVWRRVTAYYIDIIITFTSIFALDCFTFIMKHNDVIEDSSVFHICMILGCLFVVLYFYVLPTFKWRSTLGMKLLSLQYTYAHYDKVPTFLQLFMRGIYRWSHMLLLLAIVLLDANSLKELQEGKGLDNLNIADNQAYAFFLLNFLNLFSLAMVLFTQGKASLIDILSKVRIMHLKKVLY